MSAVSPQHLRRFNAQLCQLSSGRATFEKLVREFYVGVATDEVLLPMHPEQPDLEGAIQRLTGFLEQYWGGPYIYSQELGHPRLRMSHMPFTVTRMLVTAGYTTCGHLSTPSNCRRPTMPKPGPTSTAPRTPRSTRLRSRHGSRCSS